MGSGIVPASNLPPPASFRYARRAGVLAAIQIVAAFNAKDITKILDMYAESSVFMPPNEPIIRGKDALRQFYENLVTRQGASDLKMEISEVAGHGTLAYQSGTYEMKRGAGRDRGKYLFVIRKMANGWKFHYTMWNSDLAPSDN